MDSRTYYILQKLGINTEKEEKEIFLDLLNIADYLYDTCKADEENRFKRELEHLTKKPTN